MQKQSERFPQQINKTGDDCLKNKICRHNEFCNIINNEKKNVTLKLNLITL